MSTICLECGTEITSRIGFIEDVKALYHIKHHDKLWNLLKNNNLEQIRQDATVDGEHYVFIGDIVSYVNDGEVQIQAYPDSNNIS